MKYLELLLLPVLIFLMPGCVDFKSGTFKFNYAQGTVEIIYHDVVSLKENKPDYSPEKDWSELQKTSPYIPEGLTVTAWSLFQEGKVLSGKEIYQAVNLKKDFPSAADFLVCFTKDPSYAAKTINKEIFLFIPSDKKILAANGKILASKNSTIIIWPVDQQVFEYTLQDMDPKNLHRAKSLLPYFLKQQGKAKENAK